jgi:hypothetical protein
MAMTTTPTLIQVKGGWAALGTGWAVTGETQEQATNRFLEALRKHQEIMARPDPTVSGPTEPQPHASQSLTAAQA